MPLQGRCRARKPRPIDQAIERQFGWLRRLDFDATETGGDSGAIEATFASPAVTIRVTYHWHDMEPDVTIARARTAGETPYWAMVHLEELLARAGRAEHWSKLDDEQSSRSLEEAFARGANLLRDVALSLVKGNGLEVLDEIIAARPHWGVPGLDFPVDDPWYASQEGFWLLTDFTSPRQSFERRMEATAARDPTARAVAALSLGPGDGDSRQQAEALGRVRSMLDDVDNDVRRAAASSLSNWDDVAALPRLLGLLETEPADASTPVAAAATFLAIDQPSAVRAEVRDALDRFGRRGSAAARQVEQLRWRLEAHPRGYPRHIKAYIEPEPD